MSDIISTYTFLPWIRHGIANKVTATDMDTYIKLRPTINIKLDVIGKAVDGGDNIVETLEKDIQLYGPGDIVGIDKKAILKSEPHHWITDFEPNYLPYIDFYDEDFPWRYTPATPGSNDRLRPWIMLIVLKVDEFDDGRNILDKPLPYITLKASTSEVMPPSSELWAWAHVHVNDSLMTDIVAKASDKQSIVTKFENLIEKNPDLAYSRIICPRRLEGNTAYHAFLMPSFESGRLAGLGLDPKQTPFATFSSWENYNSGTKSSPQDYPYYHRWYFRTGAKGDFEYLVRLLKPRPVDSRVGVRDMDVQRPGANIQGLDADDDLGGVLKLGGALRIPYKTMPEKEKEIFDKYDQWAKSYPHPLQKDLADFLNLPDDYEAKEDPDPLITAPIYGKWHALIRRVLKDRNGNDVPNKTNWVHDLNLDPRFRVSAGFGTKIVQENQENYMKAAWKQIGEVLEANRRMRLAQLARETSWFWYNNYIKPMVTLSTEKAYVMMAPMQKRVVTKGLTVHYQVKKSKVPLSFGSVAMRTITRPQGRVMKILTFDSNIKPDNVIERVNESKVHVAPPKMIPVTLPNTDQVAEELMPKRVPKFILNFLLKNRWFRWALIALMFLMILIIAIFRPAGWIMGVLGFIAAAAGVLFRYVNEWAKKAEAADSLSEEEIKPEAVDKMPRSPNFRLLTLYDTFKPRIGVRDSKEAVVFKKALKDSFTAIDISRKAGEDPPKPKLELAGVVNATFTAIDPELTIPNLFFNTILIPDWIRDRLVEKFVEAMAYPEFDTPMYKPLVNISTELFLPNINYIGQNTISLLETNQRFIESYMVGLNHEFARELLWREYPTDQRGSYFRQFWDVSSFFDDEGKDPETLKEELRDIPPLHRWPRSSKLGKHDNREKGRDNKEEVVLVIRGELLKKYPNAVIYAHKAKWNDDSGSVDLNAERRLVELTDAEKENPPKTKMKTPLYEAKVDPDIYFFGFDLTASDAKGGAGTSASDDPGWFFVIKERPGEPRFGFDVSADDNKPNVWNDLAWENIIPEGSTEKFVRINNSTTTITLEDPATNPDTSDDEKIPQYKEDKFVSWNKNMNSAEAAYILFQAPVLVAVHATEMLPKKQ